ISAEALAAHQIALNLAAITYMCATGIAAASTIRIGNQMGLKDLRNLRVAGYTSFATVVIFMSFAAVTFILFRESLTALYVQDAHVQQIAGGLLIIAAAFQISDGLQAVGLGVLRGLTDVKVPTLITFIAYWVLAIPGGYVLGFVFDLGVNGVWYALSGGLTIAAVLHILRFRNLTRKIRFN
ncbi:MAG: MATE family efflux transporter, partial [Marinoscillum sp.]